MTRSGFQNPPCLRRSLKAALVIIVVFCMNNSVHAQHEAMMTRISEIEIHPQYLEEYKTILKQESAASVKLEKGFVAIFPMFQKENPTQVRILEIYKDKTAYQSHLKTSHFLEYKSSTLHMVKSLKLVDMDVLDWETASRIFKKLNR